MISIKIAIQHIPHRAFFYFVFIMRSDCYSVIIVFHFYLLDIWKISIRLDFHRIISRCKILKQYSFISLSISGIQSYFLYLLSIQ